MKKLFIYTLTLTLILITSACCWRSPNAVFYMMDSKGLEEISSKKLNIAVQPVNVPDLLDRSQLVTFDENSQQINIHEFNRWGETFSAVLQNTVTTDLIAYLPNSYIKSARYDTETLAHNIKIEINKIEAFSGNKIKLSVWWNITDRNGLILKRKQASYETAVEDTNISSLVKAENNAIHLLSKDIASTLSKM